MKKILIAALAVFLGACLLNGHGAKPWAVPAAAKKRKNPMAATAESVRLGGMLYQGNCLLCHGEKGDGNGPWLEKLAVKPGDFTDRHMMKEMTDGEIFWKMSTGRDPMPAFADKLSEEQRWHLVNYLRTFGQDKSGGAEKHSY